MHPEFTPEIVEQFWDRVTVAGPDDCWLWTGSIDRKMYGRFWIPRRHFIAHRVSWAIANGGEWPELNVCHTCDNPPCVNPAHLFLGTTKDNVHDMIRKGRDGCLTNPAGKARGLKNGKHARPDRIPRGEAHHFTPLTEKNVLDIRARHGSGERLTDLGREFGVTIQAISAIVKRRSWKHV